MKREGKPLRSPPFNVGLLEREFLSRDEAIAILKIQPQTLYAYVSRGIIHRYTNSLNNTSMYSKEDVEKAKTRSASRSKSPVSLSGNSAVLNTSLTEITTGGPRYRNRLATALAKQGWSFETVAEYLWTGDWMEELEAWHGGNPSVGMADDLDRIFRRHEDLHLIQWFTAVAMGLSIEEGTRRERLQIGETPLTTARRMIRVMAGVFGLVGPSRNYSAVRPGESIAAGIIRALGAKREAEATAAINRALVLVADHELNPATLSARIAASGGVDMHSCICAALSVHYGTLIGRGCDRIAALIEPNASVDEATATIKRMTDVGRIPPGFGHPLYPVGDPRTPLLLELAKNVSGRHTADMPLLAAADYVYKRLRLKPRVEFGVLALTRSLELPDQAASGLIALGRTSGWVAHILEQRLAGFLIRPRARYIPPVVQTLPCID